MTHYRFYALETPPPILDVARSMVAAEDLSASTDEESILAGWAIYRDHRGACHGFELWDGTRLVFRHVATGQGRAEASRTSIDN